MITIGIWQDSRLEAFFLCYSDGGIRAFTKISSETNETVSIDITQWQFHEWHSFALFLGKRIVYRCPRNNRTGVYEIPARTS